MDIAQSISLVWFVVLLGLNIWFLVYLMKLEQSGCECALTWRRYYLMAYIAVSLLSNMIVFVNPKVFNSKYVAFVAPILPLLSILFIVFAIQYVTYLKNSKCDCSESAARNVLYVYAWVSVAIIAIAVVQSIIFVYYMWRLKKATNGLLKTMTPKKLSRK